MTRALKIVVADDERDTREFLHEYLSHLGHEVRSAADGFQLVETCRAFAPELIVTDYAMPGLDGLAAVARLDGAVPVILISGRYDADAVRHTTNSPVVQFLTKPIKIAELKAAIDAVAAAMVSVDPG